MTCHVVSLAAINKQTPPEFAKRNFDQSGDTLTPILSPYATLRDLRPEGEGGKPNSK